MKITKQEKEQVRDLHVGLKLSANEISKRTRFYPSGIIKILRDFGVFKPCVSIQQTEEKVQYRIRASILAELRKERLNAEAYERRIELFYSRQQRVCKNCGQEFAANTRLQKMCSPKCRSAAYYKLDYVAALAIAKYKSRREALINKLYLETKPKCAFCKNDIPIARFSKNRSTKHCSGRCCSKSNSAMRLSTPEKVAAYKKTKQKTELKRKISGKTREEKRLYYLNNPSARIAKNLRNRLRLAILKHGGAKSDCTMSLTGTDRPTLMAWLQSQFLRGMSWNNYGKWHVDHKIPCSSFNLTVPENQRKCFHYTNLQPMWETENLRKGDRITAHTPLFRF